MSETRGGETASPAGWARLAVIRGASACPNGFTILSLVPRDHYKRITDLESGQTIAGSGRARSAGLSGSRSVMRL